MKKIRWIILILLIGAWCVIGYMIVLTIENHVAKTAQTNAVIKAKAVVSQQYTDAIEKELIQAWMDVCLFKTDADMSDDYDAQYMECECVVADNMNKLVEGGE